MAEVRGKTNKKFMVLSAIGIFMVVDHHTFTALNLFGDYIPYNSFFMPMFVFISGYFNKVGTETKLLPYIGKKAKTLLLPYAGISILVFVIQQLINLIKTGGIVPLPSGYLMYVLERVITSGSPFQLVTPMWFVISLFFTLLFYAFLKKLLNKIWNNFVMFGIFSILHFLSVFLAQNISEESLHPFLLPLKVLFLLPFLELGIIYKKYLEEKLTALSGGLKIGLLILLLLINVIRTSYLPNAYDVAFDSIDELAGFTSPFFVTPMLSSVIGILFWLTLTDLIAKPLYESRFVNFMSCNTFWIMGLHILFFNIFNCVLLLIDKIMELPYFDAEAFRESEWYFWEISPNIKLAYLVIGILGPLGLKWICDRIKKSLSNKKANVTNV